MAHRTRRAGGGEAEGGAPRQGILPSRRGQRGGWREGGRGPGRRKEGDRVAFEWNMDEGEGALSKLPRDA